MAQQNPMQEKVIVKAMKDEAFRQELLVNPKGVLERELGITLPKGIHVQVHEDTSTTIHIVLPMKAQTGEPVELSDAELEQAVGGQRPSISDTCRVPCVNVG